MLSLHGGLIELDDLPSYDLNFGLLAYGLVGKVTWPNLEKCVCGCK